MRLVEQKKDWNGNRTFKGQKKKYKVTVYFLTTSFREEDPFWYYTLIKDQEDYRYNSLWENLKYSTQEECITACEDKINELTKK